MLFDSSGFSSVAQLAFRFSQSFLAFASFALRCPLRRPDQGEPREAGCRLRFILEDSGVSGVGQAHLATAVGVVARFKNLVDTKGEWRAFLQSFFNLGVEGDGLAARAEVAAS